MPNVKTELERFFHTSPDLFAIADMQGFFRMVNDSFVRTTGFSRAELTTQPYINFVHSDDRQITMDVSRDWQDGTPTLHFENRYITKLGGVRWFSWRALPVPDEGIIYAAARDITELKQKEQLIEEQRSQMIESSRLNSLGQMAAGIAHEINNPLSILYLSTLRLRELRSEDNLAGEEAKVLIDQMEEMTWRMTSIIKGLKTFGRNAEHDPFEAVNAKELVSSSVGLVEAYFRQVKVKLTVIPIDPDLFVSGRAVQLSQVLVNLFMNALDSVSDSDSAWVRVEFSVSGNYLLIRVADSGGKIPDQIIGRLFEPFFTTKSVGKGTGLGLSISIGIAQEHGGELYYDRSSPTAAFILKLPLLRSS